MSRLALALAASVCLTSLAAAETPPALSNLMMLPGDATIAPAAGIQEQPAIAAGGPGYLVVWTDARDARTPLVAYWGGPYLTPGVGTMRDIYGLRLDLDGNPIDPTPFPITMATLNQGAPSVAWNGTNWLVVWQHQSGLACCPQSDILGARVSPNGVVLDPQPIAIDLAQGQNLDSPTVGSDGSSWLVVWRDWDMPAGIATLEGARVSPAGVVLDPGGVRLRRDSWNSYPTNPDIAFAGGEYLLTWIEEAGNLENEHWVKAQRFTPSLTRIDASPFTIDGYSPSDAAAVSVATDGTDFLVTWFEDRYYGWAQLMGARVSHAGVVRDPAGIPITGYSGYTQFAPAAAWSGSSWIVAYNRQPDGSFDDDLFATRISSAGAVLDPTGRPVKVLSGSQLAAAIATTAGGARVVWTDLRVPGGSPGDIYTASLSTQGVAGPEACLSVGAPAQVAPDFAWDGDHFLAVFASLTSGMVRIVGQRFDANGAALDPEPFAVASGPNLGAPAVAWDGTRYLVVWGDLAQSVLYGRRFGPDGSAIDPTAITLMPGDGPDVAALGGTFLVVGTYAQNPHFRYPRALRVRGSDAARLDPAPVVIGSYFATHMSVAALGGRWLVSWQENPTHDNPRADVMANFVEAGGAAGAQFAITASPIPSDEDPSVAAGEDTALVAWTSNAGYQSNVAARRVLSSGVVLDPSGLVVSGAANAQIEAAAGWDGSRFVLGFADFRNDAEYGQPVGDLYGARVSGGGTVLDPVGFAIANTPTVPELDPACAGGSGAAALGGSVFHPEAPYAAYRIGFRLVSPASALGVDEQPTPPAKGIAIRPNPSREVVELSCGVAARDVLGAAVYDLLGREVRSLESRPTQGGVAFTWDGRNAEGGLVSPGLYLVKVRSPGGIRTAKLVRSR